MENVRAVATRRTIQGVVVSDKNDKTIVVLVETYKRHPKYGKRVKYGKKYYAHDENNIAHNGDTVTIMETRPLSALKRFRLISVDKKAISDTNIEAPAVEAKEAE
jgi:small subunit ribosomal protein S17